MGDIPQSDIPRVLSSIFDAQDYKRTIEQLREQDLRMWVDGLDQVYRPRKFLNIWIYHPLADHRFGGLFRGVSERVSLLPNRDMYDKAGSTHVPLFPR